MKNRHRGIIYVLLGSMLLFLLPGCLGLFQPLFAKGPYKGRVIDTDTKQPLEGAAVLAVWSSVTPVIGDKVDACLDAEEVLTDKNGRFVIGKHTPISLRPGWVEGPDIIIFYPGYGFYPRYHTAPTVPIGGTVELRDMMAKEDLDMMQNRIRWTLFLAYAMAVIVYPSQGQTFATASHRVINEVAVQNDQYFNTYLTDVFGLGAGFRTWIKNSKGVEQRIIDWVEEGGAAEDQLWFDNGFGEFLGGIGRSSKHFHQPMRPWAQAGFKTVMPSSVYWAQDRNQSPGRKASWFDARGTFAAAFSARADKERNSKFAEMFQTVGQLMHLVADSASVPHARDESHGVTCCEPTSKENLPIWCGLL